jgi:sterol desaturase/sphingolipid hydroxylase (fatty acid hydroxylase superfamily)
MNLLLGKNLHVLNFYGALLFQFFLGFYQHSGANLMVLPEWIFAHPLQHEVHHKWLRPLIHSVAFPLGGMAIALVMAAILCKHTVDEYSFKDCWNYLLKHFWMCFAQLVFNAVLVCLIARFTDYIRTYTFGDLIFLPFHSVLWLFQTETIYYFAHREMHRNPFLWKHIHQLHHSTKHSEVMKCNSSSSFGGGALLCKTTRPMILLLGKNLHVLNFYRALIWSSCSNLKLSCQG